MIDTSASDNFINRRVADELQIEGLGSAEHISLATTKAEAKIDGKAVIDIDICGKLYRQVQLGLMSDLCADVILGQKFLRRHSELTLHYGGSDHPLRFSSVINVSQSVLNVSVANLTPPRIFEFLATDCKPIAAKSRRYNQEDSDFIKSEVSRLLDAGILEPARSPWRVQVLVVHQSNGKKQFVSITLSLSIDILTLMLTLCPVSTKLSAR